MASVLAHFRSKTTEADNLPPRIPHVLTHRRHFAEKRLSESEISRIDIRPL